jgi:superfamily II DNA helicase RecQ
MQRRALVPLLQQTETRSSLMRYRMFTYAIPPPEAPDDLNRFLASEKILSTRAEVVAKGGAPYILFVVEYLESGKTKDQREPRVDYREKLSEEDFQAFSRLRDIRKSIAEREGVPVYAVFTNAQLAEMVEKRVRTGIDLQAIAGVGRGKADKYGAEFLAACAEMLPAAGSEEAP